jgi:hypothetical protein
MAASAPPSRAALPGARLHIEIPLQPIVQPPATQRALSHPILHPAAAPPPCAHVRACCREILFRLANIALLPPGRRCRIYRKVFAAFKLKGKPSCAGC